MILNHTTTVENRVVKRNRQSKAVPRNKANGVTDSKAEGYQGKGTWLRINIGSGRGKHEAQDRGMLGLILLAGKRAVVSRQMAHTMYYKLGNKRPMFMCAGKREWPRAGCERRDAATKQEGGVVGLRIQIRAARVRRFRKYVTITYRIARYRRRLFLIPSRAPTHVSASAMLG